MTSHFRVGLQHVDDHVVLWGYAGEPPVSILIASAMATSLLGQLLLSICPPYAPSTELEN